MGSSIETDLVSHWCNSKFIGVSLCAVVNFEDHESYYANGLSVRCKCNFKNQNGQSISFSFCLGGWNESCGSSCHEPRKLGSDHVFVSYNKCKVPVFVMYEASRPPIVYRYQRRGPSQKKRGDARVGEPEKI